MAGHCVSLARAVLPARLLLRNLFRDISRRSSWDSQIRLTPAAVHDLEEWLTGLSKWDGRVATTRPFDEVLDTDASLGGWGAALKGLSATSAGWWKRQGRHINELELKAVHRALKSLLPLLRGKSVLLRCDNITAVAYVKHLGGRSKAMNRTTHKIFNLCKRHNIQLSTIHLPGVENNCADHLSCLYPQHEWGIAHHIFKSIDRRWGPHTVDRMATTANTKLPCFNSCFWEAGSEAVDAISQDWRGETNWVAPPIALIPQVLRLLRHQRAHATVIAPVWTGKPWFQDLLQLSSSPPIPIPNKPSSFEWQGDRPPEPLRNPRWRWAAFRICGNTEPRAGPGQR